MARSRKLLPGAAVVLGIMFLAGCRGLGTSSGGGGTGVSLTVTSTGTGSGTITSSPSGINCPGTCTANFASGTQVALTATPGASFAFGGWTGACSGTAACTVTVSAPATATANFTATLQSINHIIFMMQENRSHDHYFGAMKEYWASHGFPDQPFEGLPQFNNPAQPAATNPACDPTKPYPANDCVPVQPLSASPQVSSFHMLSQCAENPSPSWNESHVDWNLSLPFSPTPTMDGYVITAGHDARTPPPFNDVDGNRTMGYYDWNDLPYYYYMASTFGTSDKWFSPTMTRTQPNRMYLMAATSLGRAYPLPSTMTQVTAKTIFESLNDKDPSSWRVYVTDDQNVPLGNGTELGMFTFANTHLDHFAPASQFFTDLTSGNLPPVVEIDPGFQKALDEHAGTNPTVPAGRIQTGSAYVSTLINALMRSPYWKDSVFILTWDEGGGFYDHMPPQPMPSPDGIKPNDLLPGDICNSANPAATGPNCDFVYTGYRVPLIVISPFSKKNYVSHTVADYTAILKLIETRFGLAPLTQRDAAQMDMSEFFDFATAPWMTPPPVSAVPVQPDTLPCYTDHLP